MKINLPLKVRHLILKCLLLHQIYGDKIEGYCNKIHLFNFFLYPYRLLKDHGSHSLILTQEKFLYLLGRVDTTDYH